MQRSCSLCWLSTHTPAMVRSCHNPCRNVSAFLEFPWSASQLCCFANMRQLALSRSPPLGLSAGSAQGAPKATGLGEKALMQALHLPSTAWDKLHFIHCLWTWLSQQGPASNHHVSNSPTTPSAVPIDKCIIAKVLCMAWATGCLINVHDEIGHWLSCRCAQMHCVRQVRCKPSRNVNYMSA